MRNRTTTFLTLLLAAGLSFSGARAQQTAPPEPPVESAEAAAPESMAEESEAGNMGAEHAAPIVKVGTDFTLKADEEAEAIVVVGGTARVQGKVRNAVVVVAGNAEITGEVGAAVVAVLGSVKVGETAKVNGAVVSVGGGIQADKGSEILGESVPVDFGITQDQVEGLKRWFYQCVVKMRPLAPQIPWLWGVAGVFFLFYLLVAAVFTSPVRACVEELDRRPATTFLVSLLTMLLLPVVMAILIATGLGVFVVPFLLAAIVLGGIAGKVAIIEWLGLRLARSFGQDISSKPVLALLLGTVLVLLIYMVPVLGIISFFVFSVWGLGSAVLATTGSLRRELPPRPTGPAAGATPPAAAVSGGTDPLASAVPGAGMEAAMSLPPVMGPAMPGVERAGFWPRMGAGLLDFVLVCVLIGIVGGPPQGFIVALAYYVAMWVWKQTTVGGIVVGLKVVRVDGQKVTFAVALVRALAGVFSGLFLFLGFIWIAWDRDRQGWHDLIAGTLVLKQPRGTPLVCY